MRGVRPRLRIRGHRVRLELSGPTVHRRTRVEAQRQRRSIGRHLYAPNELGNLPGFETPKRALTGTLGGYSAIVAAGTYLKDGRRRAIVQQAVVVPSRSGLQVLQFNAESLQGALQLIIDVSTVINQQSRIS
jgi:probable lipoprotein LpqN